METVCFADVCFVFTGSDTAELKASSNVTAAVHRFRALNEPKVLLVLMVMMTVIMTVTVVTCYPL